MSTKVTAVLLWALAVVITLSSAVFQRLTGPTHPLTGTETIAETDVDFKLLTTHESTRPARMTMVVADPLISGEIQWRRYRSHDEWTGEPLGRIGDSLVFQIPRQPAAGKVMYRIALIDRVGQRHELTSEPVIIRFKDPVPRWALGPHIFFMFLGMLFATRAGLAAIAKGSDAYRLTLWTSICLLLGGLVFGPIVQKYAFGAFWTGWPFGHDLTDTKTAIALLCWLVALWRSRVAGRGRLWILAAAVVTFAIYLIPHSVLGSELDYTQTG